MYFVSIGYRGSSTLDSNLNKVIGSTFDHKATWGRPAQRFRALYRPYRDALGKRDAVWGALPISQVGLVRKNDQSPLVPAMPPSAVCGL